MTTSTNTQGMGDGQTGKKHEPPPTYVPDDSKYPAVEPTEEEKKAKAALDEQLAAENATFQ